jgi:hypothetical protein
MEPAARSFVRAIDARHRARQLTAQVRELLRRCEEACDCSALLIRQAREARASAGNFRLLARRAS